MFLFLISDSIGNIISMTMIMTKNIKYKIAK